MTKRYMFLRTRVKRPSLRQIIAPTKRPQEHPDFEGSEFWYATSSRGSNRIKKRIVRQAVLDNSCAIK
eukprot:CAMPEP_0169062318 /NCGR_PEP_ID=MMETSP1015-20121227/622_1 /TAXON_ID=342587 /ORGANISM="Karlodinium micrum, Strain CCMP2283" /LENGTH=67 /DNA_ID=CAMNT_0009120449 /DNA_START=133 /DNA_END=336 /DNA_ORIENTATION=+